MSRNLHQHIENVFERLRLSDMIMYLLWDMLCKMVDIRRLETYTAAMMLPTKIREDVVLMMVPPLLSRMVMVGCCSGSS